MGKTAALRKLIQEQLSRTPGSVHHRRAPQSARYPYKVYSLRDVSFVDARDDFILYVDIWNNAEDQTVAEEIADQIEHQLDRANLPQKTILPTFFREARRNPDDPDKSLQHIELTFRVQLYEKEE